MDHLIFGCGTVSYVGTPKEALRLLAQASELGIKHFDTARAYGAGRSESILGLHVKGRREQMIVTTKYGLAPPLANERLAREYERAASSRAASRVLSGVRKARRALRPSIFSPEKIRASLETSLRALGTDYVDYFLLHEATAGQAGRRTVRQTLELLVTEGKIRHFGIGSAYAKVGPYEASIPPSYRVLQFEHSPLAAVRLESALRPGRQVFTHSALSGIGRVFEALERHPVLVRAYSAALDVDVASPDVLPGLLLVHSHNENTRGKVIFSTSSSRRIVDNVEAFEEMRKWTGDRRLALRQFFQELAAEA